MQENKVVRMVMLAFFVALGVVISPILRVEGLCPMAHFINIVVAVLMGPWYALLNAVLIGILRMILMAIPPLALTGAVFGAFLSGFLYQKSGGNLWMAALGEVIGTGIIGSILSYPVMSVFWGYTNLTFFFYTPSFVLATLMGGSVALFFLFALRRTGHLLMMQERLGVHHFEKYQMKKESTA